MKKRTAVLRQASLLMMVIAFALVNLLQDSTLMSAHAAGEPGEPIRIVAFGDSLTAGFMLKPQEAFPEQLARRLKDKGYNVVISNAGVSGDTTGAGLERFDWSVPDATEAVILELGANDALRGIDPAIVKQNLDMILTRLKARNIEVLLAGMSAPSNWGRDYADDFNAIYRELAAKHGAILYPFFLDGVALNPKLNLPDGLHPTAEGIGVIVDRIMVSVEDLVGRVKARRLAAAK